jgi:hypothetical protein
MVEQPLGIEINDHSRVERLSVDPGFKMEVVGAGPAGTPF